MALAVVDASVVAKWFLKEENTLSARRLREDFLEGSLRLRVPSLLPFEVLNALKSNPNFPSRGLLSASRRIARRSRISGNTNCHSADGLKPGSHGMQMEIEPPDEPIDLLGRQR